MVILVLLRYGARHPERIYRKLSSSASGAGATVPIFSVVLSWNTLSKLRCSARGGEQKSFARNTSRAAPAEACPQAWGKKEKERERERETERLL